MVENKQQQSGDVTQLLEKLRDGGDSALEELVSFVYAELRRVATGLVRSEASGHTLRATDVVHEAYLRLFDSDDVAWENRRHFFASAAIAMRRVLIDHARRRAAGKRIPKDKQIPMEALEADVVDRGRGQPKGIDLLALDQALKRLALVDERQAQVVELRYFAGLTLEEVAELLDLSRGTVATDWRVARLWLRREMRRQDSASDAEHSGP